MHRALPPFAGLRAFEATARLGSVTGAAAELHVTQSAVSHQLKRLETFLGIDLFERGPGTVRPTLEAREYLAEVSDLLDRLDRSTRRLVSGKAPRRLRIRATPAFTSRWLIPRLHAFEARHPDIDYDIGIGFPPTDLSETDVFVHWGTAPVEGARVEPFLASPRAPVASAAYLAREGPVGRPADLLERRLLHDEVADGWPGWFERVGVRPPEGRLGPRFAHCELVLTAAEAGQGVALPYLALLQSLPEAGGDGAAGGGLVRLFDEASEPVTIYSCAHAEADAGDPAVKAFRDFLFEEAEAADVLPPTARVVPLPAPSTGRRAGAAVSGGSGARR